MGMPSSSNRGGFTSLHYLKPEYTGERFETPVDDRGLVLQEATVALVKSLFDSGYDWQDGRAADVHHFYWHEDWYKGTDDTLRVNPALFRNLPFHKALVPRTFHEVTEKFTIPPPLPSEEVMYYRTEACNVAVALFKAARGAVSTPRQARRREDLVRRVPSTISKSPTGEDTFSIEYFRITLDDYFEGFERNYRRLQRIPPEFRLVDFTEASSSPHGIATQLGRIGLPQILRRGRLDYTPSLTTV